MNLIGISWISIVHDAIPWGGMELKVGGYILSCQDMAHHEK
jgi:hypothetical protein